MKKILLAVSMFLILTAAQNGYAQRVSPETEERVFTPAKDSTDYKAIYAAVKKKHPKISAAPEVMRVQGIWARFAYKLEEIPEEEEVGSKPARVSGPNLILKKTGGEWQIVYSFDPDNDDDDMMKNVKGIPQAIMTLRAIKAKAN